MKLERLTLHIVALPLVTPFVTAQGRLEKRHFLLLEAMVNGVTAWGECAAFRTPFYTSETIETARHVLRDFLIPAIADAPVAHPAGVQTRTSWVRGHPMAKAALEMLFWDAWGKLRGQSLAQLLGAARLRVPVGVAVGLQPDLKALLHTVETYRARGYRRIKLKIKPGYDAEPVAAVRRRFPDIALQVDANAAYRRDTADALRALDSLELLLIEQPLPEDDLLGHARLQAVLRTPLCLDESLDSVQRTAQALEMDACRVVNLKAARVGGLSQALRIHALCQERNVPLWCGGMLESGLGRAANLALAALPGFTLPGDISATDRYYRQDIIQQPFVLAADGTLPVPQAPGLGVDVDRDALRRFSVHRETLPV
ncbi:MAG: o-succinylbenzoate synthase [Anaerolineae bacterium]|nr:MAG: o-succinylbenzoate synthase [Anaerolineae bacterium]